MGKKKSASGFGRALIRDRFRGQNRTSNSQLHTADLDDHPDWNRINFQSVTEQSTLDEFLAIAELAGTDFEAERLNVSILHTTKNPWLLTKEQEEALLETQLKHKDFLCVPRRPLWDESTTAEELDRKEKDSFLEWRRNLAKLQDVKDLVVTPAERNIHFWRQLWRVIERSDVVVQIVDARNPLLFRCEDLEVYVQEVAKFQGSDKINLLLINKADYLTEKQRGYWARYFDSIHLRVAFWSATEEAKRYEELLQSQDQDDSSDPDKEHCCGSDSEEDDSDDYEDVEEEEEEGEEVDDLTRAVGQCLQTSEDNAAASTPAGNEVDTNISLNNQAMVVAGAQSRSTGECSLGATAATGVSTDTVVQNSTKLLTSDELVDLVKTLHKGRRHGNFLTVGMTGYPNVGKSSTINTLLHAKKVAVSVTPGKTKHFQTMFIDHDLMLCDCPGLVMPKFVNTKADMIVSGILSIDQMREYEPAVAVVCKHMTREVLEANYGIMLPPPKTDDGEDPNRPPAPYELLTAQACIRGFMTHKGVPDYQRAARSILKDYVTGKLLYSHPPPGVRPAEFEPVGKSRKPLRQHKGVPTMKTVSNTTKVDQDFFNKKAPRAGTKGVLGVADFTRKDGSSGPHISSSQQSLNSKPWKKHFNRNKSEKLRRVYKEYDA